MGGIFKEYPPEQSAQHTAQKNPHSFARELYLRIRIRFEMVLNQACRNRFKPDLGGLITY